MAEDGVVATALCATEREGKIVDLFVHRNPDKLALFSGILADAIEITH